MMTQKFDYYGILGGQKFFFGADKLDYSIRQHGKTAADSKGRVKIMRDCNRGDRKLLAEGKDQVIDFVGHNRIKTCGRLIIKDNLRAEA